MENKKYKRVMLKLSGEALANDQGFGIDPTVVDRLCKEIKSVTGQGIQVGGCCRRGEYMERAEGKCRRHGPCFSRLYGYAGYRH